MAIDSSRPRISRTALVAVLSLGASGALIGLAPEGCFRTATRRDPAEKSPIARVKDAVDAFRVTIGRMPESLGELVWPPGGAEPFLANDPLDAWGNPFVLKRGDGTDYDILSYGADGEPGGEGENADLSYKDSVKRL